MKGEKILYFFILECFSRNSSKDNRHAYNIRLANASLIPMLYTLHMLPVVRSCISNNTIETTKLLNYVVMTVFMEVKK